MRADYQAKRDLHKAYLNSPAWRAFRAKVLEAKGCTCEKCGEYGNEVHHITYKRWAMERMEDVQVLCRECHEAHHRVHRASGCGKRRSRASLSPRGILSYYPAKRLDGIAKELKIAPEDLRRGLLMLNRNMCIKAAKALGIHVILPRHKLCGKERRRRAHESAPN